MESWQSLNYNTRNVTKWTELMNLSTTEWNLGPLPPNLVAVQGTLNDSALAAYPPGTVIIQNAGKTDLGDRAAEGVVFGLCSAVALLWAAAWLVWSIRDGTLLKPREGARTMVGRSPGSSETRVDHHHHQDEDEDGGAFHAEQFEKRLLTTYYPTVASHPEVYEKRGGSLEADEITGVSELLVRMFRNDMRLRGLRNAQRVSAEELEELRGVSDALLKEVHGRVERWMGDGKDKGLDGAEREELKGVVTALARQKVPRYRHREGWGLEGV
ncbi:hypothetical protein B0T16DRAFT_229279 [Cercophora newfieldiana]|uniref:Uncharacterized protein n=1 Tax=Cercophora newfieldiana TaxID=92897 RepID=A0AA39XS08_9PEZI|nr:hypothetical protein B0T16DRAFT_229279 [Cercophora newfieldiana]